MAGRNTKLQENILYSYFEEMGNRTLRVALINWSGDGTDSTGLYIQPVFTVKDGQMITQTALNKVPLKILRDLKDNEKFWEAVDGATKQPELSADAIVALLASNPELLAQVAAAQKKMAKK
jgi:hypothetical protein